MTDQFKWLKKIPKVRIIENSKNLYLTRAINQGLQVTNATFFLILNSDTVIKPNSIKVMLEFMKNNPQYGVSTCTHVKNDGSIDKICSKYPNFLADFIELTIVGWFLIKNLNIPKIKQYLNNHHYNNWSRKTSREVECIPGSFFIGRSSLFEKIGKFDENLLLYYQDMDYCKRIRLAGYKIAYNANLSITHFMGKSVSLLSPRLRSSIAAHDMLAYHKKHFGIFPWLFLWLVTRIDLLYWSLKKS